VQGWGVTAQPVRARGMAHNVRDKSKGMCVHMCACTPSPLKPLSLLCVLSAGSTLEPTLSSSACAGRCPRVRTVFIVSRASFTHRIQVIKRNRLQKPPCLYCNSRMFSERSSLCIILWCSAYIFYF
jgi:hypothetical protein